MNPFDLPFNRFCNYVYAWYMSRVENRDEFDRLLNAPLAGARTQIHRPSQREMDDEGAQFLSFMGQHNAG